MAQKTSPSGELDRFHREHGQSFVPPEGFDLYFGGETPGAKFLGKEVFTQKETWILNIDITIFNREIIENNEKALGKFSISMVVYQMNSRVA